MVLVKKHHSNIEYKLRHRGLGRVSHHYTMLVKNAHRTSNACSSARISVTSLTHSCPYVTLWNATNTSCKREMCANPDRKHWSARTLRYAANKLWSLTTMALFISQSPGDNHGSCFPSTLPGSEHSPGLDVGSASGCSFQHPWGRDDLWWAARE